MVAYRDESTFFVNDNNRNFVHPNAGTDQILIRENKNVRSHCGMSRNEDTVHRLCVWFVSSESSDNY